MLTKASLFLLSLGPAFVSAGLLPSWLNLQVDRRSDDICGVNGYDRDQGNYFWSSSAPVTSYAGCSFQCARTDGCESFGFNEKVCMLFDRPLTGNFDADADSDVKYFDVSCIQDIATLAPANTTISLTLTTTVLAPTTTSTRTITLATVTGGPFRPTNGTGFFPVTRHPHAATSSVSSDVPIETAATEDMSAFGPSNGNTMNTSVATAGSNDAGFGTGS